MSQPVVFKVRAAAVATPRMPRAFETVQRSSHLVQDDPFLPTGLLRIDQVLDLTPTARSGPGGDTEHALAADAGQVVVLELPEGVTVITHPANLRDTLQRIDPDAVDASGALVFDKALRSRGLAMRGKFGDAVVGGLGSLVSRIYTLTVGQAADPITEAAKRKACEWIGEKAEDKIARYADLGVSWAGTKALMWAVESRLKREPGLYRWSQGELIEPLLPGNARLQEDAKAGPLLVLIHGTGSSTQASFDDLNSASSSFWKPFEDRYGRRVLAFEHRTLSESPIDNALQLAQALPEGATLHLLTHSRGGLVGDLLCLDNFAPLIDGYALDAASLGEADPAERKRITQELLTAHAEQRAALRALAAELARKKLRIERYVRVASPARGTRLASGNFDVFLSGLLSLMGWVPAFKGNPVYSAFKRVVLEVARNRTKPNLVPGIEAMLPGSPMARLLARATPQAGVKLAVICGDIEGGGLLKRLAVLFTDFTFFDNTDNDLVVDTDAMSAGIARPDNARVMFDQGPDVSHFRYFANDATRSALRGWLLEPAVEQVDAFMPLRAVDDRSLGDTPAGKSRDGSTVTQPVTILLPGTMGSHLWLNQRERVWFSLPALALGGLSKLQWKPDAKKDKVAAEALFAQFYGDLHAHLQCSRQRVVAHPYDWRQPLDVLADQLAAVLRSQLDATAATARSPAQPVRVLAHSMGGLVVRALVHKHPALWDELMARDGARLVMLGTPNQGSHLMVETLIGKADTVRKLGVLDQAHDLQQVIDLIAGFPGALQLLPKPGFKDTGSDASFDYFQAPVWADYKKDMRDFWFGNGIGALPTAAVLAQARWLWAQDGAAAPSLPAKHQAKVAYVHGCAAKTPCGIVKEGGAWKMQGTPEGDGSVTWASGRIAGIGSFFYMPAEHGDLADTTDYFASLTELLEHGTGGILMTNAPALRDASSTPLVASYDAGPVPFPTDGELAGGLFGGGKRVRARERARETLRVRVCAMDLRQVNQPLLVGHYEQDAIAGPEALIDSELVRGELSIRHHLGLYAGAVGTASAVLLSGTALERQRGSYRGAVVAGLGKYDGSLTVGKLTDAVRTAGLRYLVHVLDSGAVASGTESAEGLKLASLLLGYNSSANLTIADSVQALLRGVIEANSQFAQTTHSKLRISKLDIVEIYLDTAITATYAAQAIAQTMNADPRVACRIEADAVLLQGEGMRQRLFDERGGGYWPRLMITDDDRPAEECLPANTPTSTAPAEHLRYLYLGQRARAESVVQQRQPGLVEQLVASQMQLCSYEADFSRTLFQLLIPHDFKDAARQMQQVVFVLDGTTANLPWELMLADDQPLATRTAMVRQLASTNYRLRPSQTLESRAYVVGNPSTQGFGAAFPDPRHPGLKSLDDLPAAEQEAVVVSDVLARQGFEVERSIGPDQRALDVVNRLFKHPYRIVHIAGHGLFDERAADGRRRSGVVLSDGLMITAAEIDAMEVVPDLVFMNCCHLGKMDRSPVAFNKLAYSVARQLIDIGVRAVVVAGWAVEDAPASLFAQTFYDALMQDNQSFGDAVFCARKATWERYPGSITWGAYQAYGEPGWKIDPRAERARKPPTWRGVAPEELISNIQVKRQVLQRRDAGFTSKQAHAMLLEVQQWFQHAPAAWQQRPDLYSALGDLYADLGPEFCALACQCFERAVLASDRQGKVPIRAIEELANAEGRLAVQNADLALAVRAIARLEQLVGLTGAVLPRRAAVDTLPSAAAAVDKLPSPERAGLLGSAYKRKAAIHARAYLDGDVAGFALMQRELSRSADAYGAMASQLGAKIERPYHTLNWLFLWSLTADAVQRSTHLPLAQGCAASANAAFAQSPEAWNATMVAEAALVAALLNQALDAAGALGEATVDDLARTYDDCLHGALITPKEREAVMRQIALMSLFYLAHEKAAGIQGPSTGARLQALAQRLTPSGAWTPPQRDAATPAAGPAKAARRRGAKTAASVASTPHSRRPKISAAIEPF